ncbi:MAG: murein biosynthesis integral membrane protein MurJ [Desulfococcaceae bacterium]
MARAAGVASAATLLGRILGFVRDAAVAAVFGAGPVADAFIVAFRIPNLWRRLVAEGALTVAFIPAFLEVRVREGRRAAGDLAAHALRQFGLLLFGVAGLGMAVAPFLVSCMAPGFVHRPEVFDLAAALTRVMLPYLPLAGMAAVCMGALQAEDRFAAPALAPVCLNLAMIAAVFGLAAPLGSAAIALALGVLLGGGLQLALQAGALRQNGFSLFRRPGGEKPNLARLAARTVPAALGASVLHVNLVAATFLASFLPEGRVAALYFADRLLQFPLGLIGAALGAAALPSLSRDFAAGDWNGFLQNGRFALRLAFFLTLPAAAGLLALRAPIVGLLFGRGAFQAGAVRETATALLGFGLGLPAFAGVRVVLAACFATGDARLPLWTGLCAMGINLVLGWILLGPWGHAGVALGVAGAGWTHLFLLLVFAGGGKWRFCDRFFWKSACQSLAGSLIMSPVAVFVARLFPPTGGTASQAVALVAAIAAGVFVYGLFSHGIRHPEFSSLLAIIRKE